MKGYVQVYTGDGKGKTTAAIGLAVRAAGAGLKVFLAQFCKAGEYSEIRALERFSDLITCRQYGSGKWLQGRAGDEEIRLAGRGFKEIQRIVSEGGHDLVILDEINVAEQFGLVSSADILGLVEDKPVHVELVFTGREADPRLVERADLCTEMREIKHYFTQGVLAREGIEN